MPVFRKSFDKLTNEKSFPFGFMGVFLENYIGLFKMPKNTPTLMPYAPKEVKWPFCLPIPNKVN